MNVNDRGTKKWTAMMMPEHIKMINDLWAEDDKKEKPFIDEQLQIEFGIKLRLALKDDLTVEVEYYADHDYHTEKGKLIYLDPISRQLRFDGNDDYICLDDIIDVNIL